METAAPTRRERAPTRARSRRKEQTRRQLIQSALAVVAEKGFANASVTEIAERAGLTTGAIYSNFRSKEALLLELVEMRLQESIPDPTAPLPAGAPATPELQRLVETAVAAAHFADTPDSRPLLMVQIELYLRALRDAELRGEMDAQAVEAARRLGQVLERVEAAPHPGPPPAPEQLAEILYACTQGMQQHRMMTPALVPDELFEWLVRALLFAARAPL
jgi:AcrR family transcriptional regulator